MYDAIERRLLQNANIEEPYGECFNPAILISRSRLGRAANTPTP
jgi:hypothetical protein